MFIVAQFFCFCAWVALHFVTFLCFSLSFTACFNACDNLGTQRDALFCGVFQLQQHFCCICRYEAVIILSLRRAKDAAGITNEAEFNRRSKLTYFLP